MLISILLVTGPTLLYLIISYFYNKPKVKEPDTLEAAMIAALTKSEDSYSYKEYKRYNTELENEITRQQNELERFQSRLDSLLDRFKWDIHTQKSIDLTQESIKVKENLISNLEERRSFPTIYRAIYRIEQHEGELKTEDYIKLQEDFSMDAIQQAIDLIHEANEAKIKAEQLALEQQKQLDIDRKFKAEQLYQDNLTKNLKL